MRNVVRLVVPTLLPGLLLAAGPEPSAPMAVAPEAKIALFDGKSLDGWYTYQKATKREDPDGVYSVRDGAIRISGDGAGYLATDKSYRDYHLSLEYRWGEKTDSTGIVRNSGLLLHGTGPDGAASGVWMGSLEVQLAQGCEGDLILIGGGRKDATISSNVRVAADKRTRWDPKGEPRKWSGRQFWWRDHEPFFKETLDNRGKDDVASKVGEWTRVEAICRGDRVTVKINGTTVNEAFDVRPAGGRILLQNEGNEVWFRKVVLRPLDEQQ